MQEAGKGYGEANISETDRSHVRLVQFTLQTGI
jgi:hypothetical protein